MITKLCGYSPSAASSHIVIIIYHYVVGITPMSGMWFRVCGRIRTRVSTNISLLRAHCLSVCGVRRWFGANSVVKMGCSLLDFCLASGIHKGRWT